MTKSGRVMMAGLVMASGMVWAAELYVNPNGADTSAGSKEHPLASLEGARRAALPMVGKEPVNIWVQGGTYNLGKTFKLGPEDSGSEKAPVVYCAVPGDEVVLKGSLPLNSNGWKRYRDGIYQQSLKGTALEGREINQLFMSNKRMIRARYPNWDFENPLRTGKGYLRAGDSDKPSMKKIEWEPGTLDDRVGNWKNPTEGIVHAFHRSNWGNFQFRIGSIDTATRFIHFSEGGWQAQRRYGVGAGHKNKDKKGSPFYIENIFEELDSAFEWYHDAKTDVLYFKPPVGVDLSETLVEAAVLDQMIECVGVKHVSFEGFHLTQTQTTFMDAYEDLARGDWAIHRGGAVYFQGSEDCFVKNCHIEQVGGNGIFVDGYNRDVHISGCLIEETGESAVCFVGNPTAVRDYQTWEKGLKKITDLEPGPKTEDYPRDCSVKNSIMRDVGIYGKQTSGIVVSMAMDITADHCSVYRVARAGVTINDGTWGGHVMSNCDIYDTVLDTGEHGPFNAWGRERFWRGNRMDKKRVLLDAMKPVVLRNNRVGNYRSGISAGNWTIDLDDGSSNFEIYNNLMLGSTLKLRDGYYRTVTNNIMVSAVATGFHCWPADHCGDVFKRNITVIAGAIEGTGQKTSTMIRPARMPDDISLWGTIDNNVWWNQNAKDFSIGKNAGSFSAWQKKQGKNSVWADPLFVDPENRNYQVKPESPALQLGFKNFPMDQFGHQMTRMMCGDRDFEDFIEVVIRPDARGGEVRYTLDGSEPTASSTLYTKPLNIKRTSTITANTFDPQGHKVGFADQVHLTKVDKVQHQSWLASYLAGEYVGPVQKSGETKGASRPWSWAGMELVSMPDYPDYIDASGGQSTGAFVTSLHAGSVAAKAGLKKGDTIIEINGQEIATLAELKSALRGKPVQVKCTVFRGYKQYKYVIKLGR